jgi:hypothetical protein
MLLSRVFKKLWLTKTDYVRKLNQQRLKPVNKLKMRLTKLLLRKQRRSIREELSRFYTLINRSQVSMT